MMGDEVVISVTFSSWERGTTSVYCTATPGAFCQAVGDHSVGWATEAWGRSHPEHWLGLRHGDSGIHGIPADKTRGEGYGMGRGLVVYHSYFDVDL